MDELARKKVLEKIQKLLRMAEGKANVNESATAARQAEALMRKFNLDMKDVILEDLKNKKESIQSNWSRAAANMGPKSYHKRVPNWAQWVATECADLFDSWAAVSFVHGVGKVVRFIGYTTDVEVCKWTFDYLIAEIRRHTKEYITKEEATTTMADAYRNGITLSIVTNLKEAAEAKRKADAGSREGTALVVAKRSAIEALLGQDLKYGKGEFDPKKMDASVAMAYVKGRLDGKKVRVTPNPVEDKTRKPQTKGLLK